MKSPESSPTPSPKQESISSEEAEHVHKEMHMTGRAMRVDETPEEYKAEREKSWEERGKPKAENLESKQFDTEVETSTRTVSDLGQARIYDRSGKLLIAGDPDQLLTFWKNKDYGAVENIGSISDGEGATIMRFGPEDGRGFFSRQRIEGVFQKLGEEVATRKRSAEDTQKLRETRANLGVAEESLPAPKSAGQTETSRATERSESVQEENIFDDEKANQVVAVMKDWAKYGGKLYDHLTGKDPRLKEGVDWQRNPDGSVDRESYSTAVKKRAEAWLTAPGSQKWFDDFAKFHKEHAKEMSSEEKKVQIRNADGTPSEKMRRTAPYLYQDGWLYHESNYFDEQKGEMTQPEREKNKYRAYINVGGGDLMQTFGDVIEALGSDPELKKLGFQIKTADARISDTVPVDKYKPNGEMRSATEEEKKAEQAGMAMNVMNQKDRIVAYFGEKGIERAIPILRRYAEQNRSKFEKSGVLLSQILKDSTGKDIPGMSITSETKGTSPDPTESVKEYKSFSDMQNMVLLSSLRSLKVALSNPKTLESIGTNYPHVKERLAQLKPNASQEDFVRAVVSDTEGEEFLVKQLKSIYPQWAKAFGMSGKNVAFKDGGELGKTTLESSPVSEESTIPANESGSDIPSEDEGNHEYSQREKKWESTRKEIDQITDATGRGIDGGIKETVTAFNVNEIPTSQSCEGHEEVEGGHRPWPWVEVAAQDEPEERFVGEAEAFVKSAQENNVPLEELKKGHPEDVYWKLRQEVSQKPVTPEYQEWEKKNKALHGKVTKLLAEFYQNRKAEAGIRLEAEGTEGGSFEISSVKEVLNKFLDNELTPDEKTALLDKLPERQKEMQDFTEFLKNRFLGGEKVGNQESQENPIEALESSSLETIKKFDLAQLLLDRKQAAQLGSFDVIESDEHRKQLEQEMGQEYRTITELLNKIGLQFQGEPPKEDNGIYGFSLVIAKTPEDLVNVVEADKTNNDKKFGVLMGYPKTAVDAYQTENAFDLDEKLPKEELDKLKQEGVLAFLEFMPSKGHWQEELDSVRETQRLIKEKAPELYEEILEGRKKEARESRKYDIPADGKLLVEYAKTHFKKFVEGDPESFKKLWTDEDLNHFKQYMNVSVRTMSKEHSGEEEYKDDIQSVCRTTEEKLVLQRIMVTSGGSAMSLEELDKQPFSKVAREYLGVNVEEVEGDYYKHFNRRK